MQIHHCALWWKHYNVAHPELLKSIKSAEFQVGYEILLFPYEVQ